VAEASLSEPDVVTEDRAGNPRKGQPADMSNVREGWKAVVQPVGLSEVFDDEARMGWLDRLFGKLSPTANPAVTPPVPTRPPGGVQSVDHLYNLIGYVVLRAPDRFPVEDYLAEEDQMTLERAFGRLRDGILIVYPEDAARDKRAWLNDALDRSLAAYRQGDDVGGAHILQDDFQDAIFKQG